MASLGSNERRLSRRFADPRSPALHLPRGWTACPWRVSGSLGLLAVAADAELRRRHRHRRAGAGDPAASQRPPRAAAPDQPAAARAAATHLHLAGAGAICGRSGYLEAC